MSTSGTGSYVYLAAPELPDDAVAGLTGIGGAPLRLVHHAGLVAVVSTVDLGEFGADALRRNLEDLGWLEGVARSHHEVVDRVARITAVAPWRLATIMLDDDRVTELLQTWQAELHSSLDRVRGCAEWSVKLYAELPAPATASSGSPGTQDGIETGTAYLRRRRAETAGRARTVQQVAAEADEVHRRLSTLAVAGRLLPPQDRRLTGHQGEMVLNAAYLVPEERGADFTTLVHRLDAGLADARLDLQGPWPPYSFTTIEAVSTR